MATHKSAEKRARQSLVRRARNKSQIGDMRTTLKNLRKLISEKKSDLLQASLREVTSKIQRLAEKGVIHNNKASRLISRAAKQVAQLLTAGR